MVKKIFFIVLDITVKVLQLKFLFRFFRKHKIIFWTLFCFIFFCLFFWLSQLNFHEILAYRESLLKLAEEQSLLSGLVFCAVCVFVTITGLPGINSFGIVGGFVFGFLKGFLLSMPSALLGSCLSVLMIRFFFRDFFMNKGGIKLKKLFDRLKKNEAYYLFAFRLFPFTPYALTNVVMGLGTMKMRVFFIIALITLLPYMLIYNYIGAELSKINRLEDFSSNPSLLIVFSIVAFLPILLKYLLNKRSLIKALNAKDLAFNEN